MNLEIGGVYERRDGGVSPPVKKRVGGYFFPFQAGGKRYKATGHCSEEGEGPADLIRCLGVNIKAFDVETRVCTMPITRAVSAWERDDVVGFADGVLTTAPVVPSYWFDLADAIDRRNVEIPSRARKLWVHPGGNGITLTADNLPFDWRLSLYGTLPPNYGDEVLEIDLTAFRVWYAARKKEATLTDGGDV